MRAKFGSDPTAGSKNLSFKFRSRFSVTIPFIIVPECSLIDGSVLGCSRKPNFYVIRPIYLTQVLAIPTADDFIIC